MAFFDTKSISMSIIATVIVAISIFLYSRYVSDEIQFCYQLYDIKAPYGASKENAKYTVMYIKLKNNVKSSFQPDALNVYGVKSFIGINHDLVDKNNSNIKLMPALNGNNLNIKIDGVLQNEEELKIYIWGDFYNNLYIELANKSQRIAAAQEAISVIGIEKYFVTYWRVYLGFLGLMLLLLLNYRGKLSSNA